LLQEREEKGIKDVAIFRLEQYYPFPSAALTEHLKLYKQAELVWCQEEPMNMGAWMFLDRRLERILEEIGAAKTRPIYVGRPAAASPSTGMLGRHQAEQEEVVRQALVLEEKVARGVYAI
jgi:2-oxoglutarate dehydrogenase E1 component